MTHYVFIHFYARISKELPDRNWLDKRMEIFKAFTMPSILGQTQLPTGIFLIVDEAVPSEIVSQLVGLSELNEPLIVRGQLKELTKQVKKRVNELEASRIIMTMLDSDDCLHKDFCKTVQTIGSHVVGPLPYVIDIVEWIRIDHKFEKYHTVSQSWRRQNNDPDNRSIMYSIVSEVRPDMTIPHELPHNRLGKAIGALLEIDCPGLQVAHNNNTLIHLDGSKVRVTRDVLTKVKENYSLTHVSALPDHSV
jgi:hypothetical protein